MQCVRHFVGVKRNLKPVFNALLQQRRFHIEFNSIKHLLQKRKEKIVAYDDWYSLYLKKNAI
jgi:hypothetical protein